VASDLSGFFRFRAALPKKRCLELSGAHNPSIYFSLESSRHLFFGQSLPRQDDEPVGKVYPPARAS